MWESEIQHSFYCISMNKMILSSPFFQGKTCISKWKSSWEKSALRLSIEMFSYYVMTGN